MTANGLQAHDDLQARIWADERMAPGTREVALAMAWVLHRSAEGEPFGWNRLRQMLGHDGHLTRGGHGWRMHDLIAGDAPRYECARNWSECEGSCEGPRLRPYRPHRPAWDTGCVVSRHHPHLGDCRFPQIYGMTLGSGDERDDRVCGAHATVRITERDMVTGWERTRWFCSRHRQRAAEVKAMLAARGEPPEPIPNAGGCLPRYFAADWAAVYARYCEKSWTVHGWKPPYHGVDADDWPVPGRTLIPKRPRLSLVAADAS